MNDGAATMQVARLYAWGDVRVETSPLPVAGPGELVVRIEACGLCGSDALRWYVERKAPVVLGHEPAGSVVATGADVTGFATGDRVFVHHHAPCDQCAECRRGLWSNCAAWRVNGLHPGGFAQFARVAERNVARDTLRLPDSIDFDTATFIEPLACCLRAVHRAGRLAAGDTVCIIGLGAMGLLMVQLARAGGAAVVVGADFLAGRRALAERLGAHATFDPRESDPGAAVRAATDGRGADVVIVCPGDARAVHTGIATAAPGARAVCFTPLSPDEPLTIDQSSLYFREISIVQSYSCGPDETREALRLLERRRIDVEPLTTHRAGLDGVAAALERAAGKDDGIKTIIQPWRVRDAVT
jgi:L-iditol 2-dehydrogenase